jgi:molybdopterin/thiamine biosynthesis adenylyltransferase
VPDSERYARQGALVPRDRLNRTPVTVIGCGAIGRQVALQLGAIGVPQLQLIDFDTVDPVNLATQGFPEAQLGWPKVEGVATTLLNNNSTCQVERIAERWRPKLATHDVVFCCVDSIDTRSLLWKALERKTDFWADARMLKEIMRVFAAWDAPSRAFYTGTLFPESEAQVGACAAQATIYTASIAAALLVTQYTKWLRGLPNEKEVALNLLSMELEVTQ